MNKVDDSWVTTETISNWPTGKLGTILAWIYMVGLGVIPILGGLIIVALLVVGK